MATENDKIEFSKRVEELAEAQGLSLLTACFEVADEQSVEEDQIHSHIHPVLKEKIRMEAISNRVLRVEQENNLDFLFNQ
ncbi:late promoter transcription accessory protein [Aeromonas phage AS-yj]|uniref:Late transcription coactivator n=7 Tax=Caudoviricetes TaxID=2731619 RepID=A0A291LDJ1_9CAUD|nr:late promoter transcription accessory protein [Aeromonas phage CC2]YP_009834311.1 late promoter transcription accessory protein [Aeromonas phage AS-zj]YP_009834942.1 late promoter transcription accessory protein [Aeromonas phage AS-sw]ATI17457.1 late promoter transcription accessory protein [Aeromonas phage AS-szw]ATI17637.1 late promoter transcription accessory protein [Aeromonas phage AS-yj]QAX97897.1 late promoter transcription accessory protein [Aeromonas phage Asswx_1]QAX99052.1 late 